MPTASPDLAALAATARGYADQHPPGSLGRRAWGCAAVALATTRSLKAARSALEGVRPTDVREAALRALDALTEAPEAHAAPTPSQRHTVPTPAREPMAQDAAPGPMAKDATGHHNAAHGRTRRR